MDRIAKLFTIVIALMALLAPGIMAAPVSAPPSEAYLTAEMGPVTTEPLPASTPCTDSGIASHSPLVPPATDLPVPEQEEEEDGDEPIVSCDVGATVAVSQGTDNDGDAELRVKICNKDDHDVTCTMNDITFELEGCITVKRKIQQE